MNARAKRQRVSIVIPAYNAAATIADTLTSLFAQPYREWEAIVVDDGSTDGTAKRAAQAARRDPRVRVVTQENEGESSARNQGIGHSHFDWLLFLDADDWIASDYLEKMTAQLDADASLDAVHCGYARVAADGTHVVEPYQPPAGDLFPTLARRAAFPVHACVVRKVLVEEVGLFDRSLRTSPDWDLWQRIARTGANFGAVREVLAFYRMSPQGASLDGVQLFTDGMRILRQGAGPDSRVRRPHPNHAQGLTGQPVVTQEFYLLAWCAALMIGAGKDATSLFGLVGDDRFPELYPEAVAQCLFDAVPLPTCQPPRAWETLWPKWQSRIDEFFARLEHQAQAPGLARRAGSALRQMILMASPMWSLMADAIGAMNDRFEQERRSWHQLAAERNQDINDQRERLDRLTEQQSAIEADRQRWQNTAEELATRQAATEVDRQRWQNTAEELAARQAATEAERLRWQGVADERERVVLEYQRLVEQLNHTKELLEADRANWQLLAKEREQSLTDHQHLIQQLSQTKAVLEEERDTLRSLAEDRRATIASHATSIERLEGEKDTLEATRSQLQEERTDLTVRLHERTLERDRLRKSLENKVGDLILNRLRLRRPITATSRLAGALAQQLSVARLAAERLLSRRPKVIATACDVFPIYSQTFVYQELTQLTQQGFDLRFVYSKLDERDYLQSQFSGLWNLKRRLFLNQGAHERDFDDYRRRFPQRTEQLLTSLSDASGLSPDALATHGNVLQAFSFTRMVEAYRPSYLHSYFFYDRSLMALVAAFLLEIPRGVSCYADHLLEDYELKVVPLHLELCDIVVATSDRIKQELIGLAPRCDPSRILVKPNGIDTDRFPRVSRTDPSGDAPFRLISLCRIEPKKGLLDLVEAVHLLRSRGIAIEAHIVGTVDEWSQASKDYKARLDQRISELNLWGKVHLEGRQNLAGILRFLGMAHIFVAPFVETESGDKDGIPTALLEGMSTGLPVVATDAGSITEVIQNGQNGLLTGQHQPQALADAIEALLRDADRRCALAARAAETVRLRYDVKECEKTFHQRVRDVINRRSGSPGRTALPL